MSFPQIFEVTLGLIVVYYILGAVVSLFTQIVMESRQTRGAALESRLREIAGSLTPELKNLPQVRALRPIRYGRWWNVFGAGTQEKKVEKIPVETLVDAFFDVSGLTSQGSLGAGELEGLISKLPDSDGKQAMLGWIHQGVTTLSELRSRTSTYFSGILNQAALIFRAKARSCVIITSILITLAFGVDSVKLAQDLWTDAGLRSAAAEQARTTASQPMAPNSLPALVDQLSALSIHIGWWQDQGLPSTSSAQDWIRFVLFKILGLGITAAAVSQGSSFWYDMLKKLTGADATPVVAPQPSEKGGALG
jgi:hypothetical protein